MREIILKFVNDIIDFIVNYMKNKEDNISKSVDNISKGVDNISNNLENKLEVLRKEKEKAEEELKDSKEELKKSSSKNKELENNIQDIEKKHQEIEKKYKEIKQEKEKLEQSSKDTSEKNIKLESEIKELKSFKEVFSNDKLLKLLDSIVNNPALKEYREQKEIKDESATSIYNLLLLLNTAQVFVSSYYDYLSRYKEEHQDEMVKEEVNFYLCINDYFEKTIISNPGEKKVDGKFDKSKHRTINQGTSGEISDGIILIPSDTTNNDKVKVKVKK